MSGLGLTGLAYARKSTVAKQYSVRRFLPDFKIAYLLKSSRSQPSRAGNCWLRNTRSLIRRAHFRSLVSF